MKKAIITDARIRRKRRVRAKINGTKDKPRICVFRSNKNIYVQVVNDLEKKTLLTFSSLNLKKEKNNSKINKTNEAKLVGLKAAELIKKIGITKAVFDRNYYLYHGRVKALVEGLREGGINI